MVTSLTRKLVIATGLRLVHIVRQEIKPSHPIFSKGFQRDKIIRQCARVMTQEIAVTITFVHGIAAILIARALRYGHVKSHSLVVTVTIILKYRRLLQRLLFTLE